MKRIAVCSLSLMIWWTSNHTDLRAQEPAPAVEPAPTLEDQVRDALRVVKSRKLSWLEKERALDDLMWLGPLGMDTLVRQLEKDLKKFEANYWKERASLEKVFEKSALALAKKRLDKKALQKIHQLRSTLLSTSRSASLTKEQVKPICDPSLAALEAYYVVTSTQVIHAEEEIASQLDAIDDALEDHLWIFGFYQEAQKQLLEAEGKWKVRAAKRKSLQNPEHHRDELYRKLDDLAFAAIQMPTRDRKVLAYNLTKFATLKPEEIAGVQELNLIRIWAGIPALRVDPLLCVAGRGHSEDMVTHGFFAHQSPVEGKKSPSDRARLAGTSGGAENIAAGQDSGHGAIQAWWYSPGHHRNMMGGHGTVGLGRFENHWTQMFG
ncbi:MAG: CAP domain-containing protein [Planctomycetes bacterium]|nr:CAP domain-containing protein [Planctomycetota bacterium]